MTLSDTQRRAGIREELEGIIRNIRDLRENPGSGGRRDQAARMAIEAWGRLAAVTGNPGMAGRAGMEPVGVYAGMPEGWPWGPDREEVRTRLGNLLDALSTAPRWEDPMGDGWMQSAWDELAETLGEERMVLEESPEQPVVSLPSIGDDPCRGLVTALFHAERAQNVYLELAGNPQGQDREARHELAERDARLAHRLLRLTHRRLAEAGSGAKRSDRQAMMDFIRRCSEKRHERLLRSRRDAARALGIFQREPEGLESASL